MRRLVPGFFVLGLMLMVACQATSVVDPLTPTSSRAILPATSTTGRPTLSPTASIDFNAVFRQLARQLGQTPFVESSIIEDSQRALAAYLNTRADRRLSLDHQPAVIDELRGVLDSLPTPTSDVTISDADGDGRLDVLVSIPAAGLPGFVIRDLPEGFVGYQVPEAGDTITDGPIAFERVDDLDGDGVPEIVQTTQIVGASAMNTLITISRWDGQGFKTLLQTGISDWAGAADWELVEGDRSADLVTTCSAVGPYDHKLLPHPRLTRTYRWQAGTLILDQTRVSAPTTVREQVNAAESAFRKGQLDQAQAAYLRAVQDATLAQESETEQVDWRAYAEFRIGELEALRGNASAAQEAMARVAKTDPSLSEMATAFLEGYGNGDAASGLAMVQHVNLHEQFYFENAGNLGFPMDAAGVLYPGLAIAAYLNTHPDAGRGSGEALTGLLRDLALDVASSAIVDLDGNGQMEVLVVLNQAVPQEMSPDGQTQTLWLITWDEAGWWPQPIETASRLMLTETMPMPEDGRRAVVYQRPDSASPRQAAVSWDGVQVLHYNLPGGEEPVPVAGNADPFQCTIP
ncbi:MAG: tol-pal system YbgF family protein [Anaerolineae bacterium]